MNLFRQLGSMLGPAVLGTIATSRFPALLADHLGGDGLPADSATSVAAAISHGQAPTVDDATLRLLSHAVPDALSTALHGGLLTGGIVLLVVAVLAALFVHHR
ncbi:hypothetical protein [Micromonospora sp. CB01531]|uniref:hypothetical protein n=1 Tax=Micromonospora sp. CB01531 TaxID=1718947 RepID=UPI00093D8BBC|nr:hypothetical protein [Micromonospora sp. CB01531]OKI41319.1 hypothetical protein A6A27_39295 [Micromonospora sp. CB01531]